MQLGAFDDILGEHDYSTIFQILNFQYQYWNYMFKNKIFQLFNCEKNYYIFINFIN